MFIAARDLSGWVRQHAWVLFLATVAAFPQLHYSAHGPPADLFLLPGLAVALFLVLPLWAATVHDTYVGPAGDGARPGNPPDRLALVASAIGMALAIAPTLVWAYAPGGTKQLKADPTMLVVGAGLGLGCVLFACVRGGMDLRAWGLGAGDHRWWRRPVGILLGLTLVCIPIVAWLFPEFVSFYPRYKAARAGSVSALVAYQVAMGLYMFSWEYLFRGFMLFGLARWTGPIAAILIQAYPFFLLHEGKPEPEFAISWFGGLLMGWLCWRAGCMWPSFLLHWVLYATMEVSAFTLRAMH